MEKEHVMASSRRGKSEPTPPPDEAEIDEFIATRFARADKQTSLRLPYSLYNSLTKAAVGHDIGLGEEIRMRLENSIGALPVEPETRALTDMLANVARNIERTYGEWHKNPYAFVVFREALNTLLAYLRPKGEPAAPKPEPDSRASLFFPQNTSPEAAGKAFAMAAIDAAGRPAERK
jgi:hypothetical protein